MAVEDQQLNLFYSSKQITSNREMTDQGNENMYGNEVKFGNGTNQMECTGIYHPTGLIVDTIPLDDIGLVCPRKRSSDWYSFDSSFLDGQFVNQNQPNSHKGIVSFLGQDISMQMYQQQQEIDCFIAHYTETVRSEIADTRRRNSIRLMAAAEEGMKKRLRSKEEEIEKIGRWNRALEEKARSLSEENQIWQRIAQTNEDRAKVLRRNLDQVLTQQEHRHAGKIAVDEVESRCGSNDKDDHQQQRTLAKKDAMNQGNDVINAYCTTTSDNNGSRWCRNCGKEELCVLVLPCRHLCICTVCESLINFCPICKCLKTASVHVNMNSF